MVCKLLLFVVDVKVVVAVVVVAVFFWLGQVHHVKKKKKRQQQLWNAISLLRLVAVSFAAVISLSVHQKGFNSRLLVCLFALVCALFTVRLAVCFLNFQFFQRFFKTYFLELRFVVCLEYMGILSTINCMASTNTWDNNTCLSVLLLLLLWIYNLLMGVLFSFFVFVNFCVFRNGSLQHFQTLTFSNTHFLFTFCSFVFRIFCLFVTLSHLFWDVAQVCCFRFSLLFMFVFFFFFGCLAVLL